MTWQAPAALWGLLLVAGPVLVHLLVRRHARRVVFPAMRFVPAVHGAAVRLRRPSDVIVMLLRAAVVATAALAATQPVLVTPARQRAWASRVARAVVVDTSASVETSAAGPLADAELDGVGVSQRFASDDLRDAIARAQEWLRTAAAGRREIVVVSDFQAGALDAGDLAAIDDGIGVRFVRAGRPRAVVAPRAAVDGWRHGRWTPSIAFDAGGTRMTWARTGPAAVAAVSVLAAAADRAAADRALAAALSFGVAVPDAARPIEIQFAGAEASQGAAPSTPWIVSAAIALAEEPAPLNPLSIDERHGVLVARSTVAAASPFAPAVIRAVLLAAAPPVANREAGPAVTSDAMLARWRREATPGSGAIPPETTDGRWLWAGALVLLAIEEAVRRHRRTRAPAEGTHARAA